MRKQPNQLSIFNEEQLTIELLRKKAASCNECSLRCSDSKPATFSTGIIYSPLMIAADKPHVNGEIFENSSDALLNKALNSVDIDRTDVYITNIFKSNERPTKEEEQICSRLFFHNEIKIVNPLVILALGTSALRFFTNPNADILKYRGKFIKYNNTIVMPTFHPSDILKNPSREKDSPARLFWEDLKTVINYIDAEGFLLRT